MSRGATLIILHMQNHFLNVVTLLQSPIPINRGACFHQSQALSTFQRVIVLHLFHRKLYLIIIIIRFFTRKASDIGT